MMKRLLIIPALLVLAGCDDLPDNKSGSGQTSPGTINMKYLGLAQAGAGDPIDGCRVYGYALNGDTQTVVLCEDRVAASGSHKKEK